MDDRSSHNFRVIRDYRTYAEAHAASYTLTGLGVPRSAVDFQVHGLRYVKPPERVLALLLLGIGIGVFITGLLAAAVLGKATAAATGFAAVGLLIPTWWLLSKGPRWRAVAGYAIADRYEVTVSQPYAPEAVRILGAAGTPTARGD